ncbi:MAG TPA: hypothetical protein VD969_19545 [Symbiobacteriaceae bacterium]|nr:hypothetical protein [Symbiobacteriaceae bacterium]
MTKTYLTRDAILKATDLPTEPVDVPEWGGTVLVRGLNGAERDAYEASMVKQVGKEAKMNMENMRAKLVAMCIVDGDGKRIFTQADAEALGKKSGNVLQRVFLVAQRLSGLATADLEISAKN